MPNKTELVDLESKGEVWTRDTNSKVVDICMTCKSMRLDNKQKGFKNLVLGVPRLINQGHGECVGVQARLM